MITPLLEATAPELFGVYGVGIDTAAALLVAAGDNPERLRSEAAWAHLCGVSPLQASSGRVTRHRLYRSGQRQATAPCGASRCPDRPRLVTTPSGSSVWPNSGSSTSP